MLFESLKFFSQEVGEPREAARKLHLLRRDTIGAFLHEAYKAIEAHKNLPIAAGFHEKTQVNHEATLAEW